MACEYFSSASANCPFLNSRFPSFFSRARGGGRAPHGASRLIVSLAVPPTGVPFPLLFLSAWTEAVEPLLLVPLATLSLDSCVTLYLSELPPLLLQCPWWELLDSLCGPPSPLPWGFFWALPMSPLSTGAAELFSPPTSWLGSTRQAGRDRRGGRDREKGSGHTHRKESVVTSQWGRVGHTRHTQPQSYFKEGVPGSSHSQHWIAKVMGGGGVDNSAHILCHVTQRDTGSFLYLYHSRQSGLQWKWLKLLSEKMKLSQIFSINHEWITGQFQCQRTAVGINQAQIYRYTTM